MRKLITSLQRQRQFRLKSQGASMLPFLRPGDVVYYKRIKLHQYLVKDLVLVKKKSRYFTHRIIYQNNRYMITKGDNNPESDGKINPDQIVGRAYQIKRNSQIIDPEQIYLLQSSLYFQEIVKIKQAFEKENIDFVFLKDYLFIFIMKKLILEGFILTTLTCAKTS